MKNFNPKMYKDKERIYVPVPNSTNLSKFYIWNKDKKCYETPERGKCYQAKKHLLQKDGTKKRVVQFFDKVDEARAWQQGVSDQIIETPITSATTVTVVIEDTGPLFKDVVAEWKPRHYKCISDGTRENYEKYLQYHLCYFYEMPIRSITHQVIDDWIDWMIANIGKVNAQSSQRKCFTHELSAFRVIIKYYLEYHDDALFRNPLKERHSEAVKIHKQFDSAAEPDLKDLTVQEFGQFLTALKSGPQGSVLHRLAIVQFHQALRISEAAALHWEDIYFDANAMENSRVRVCRHVIYLRKGAPYIALGFKNAQRREKIKEQPMFPETYEAIKSLELQGITGLLFRNEEGSFFTYRQIQYAFNKAFSRAKLQYSSTHILRHGGTRNVYNETGDLAIAQQLLGNSDLKSTLVYAQREKGALTKVAKDHWKIHAAK